MPCDSWPSPSPLPFILVEVCGECDLHMAAHDNGAWKEIGAVDQAPAREESRSYSVGSILRKRNTEMPGRPFTGTIVPPGVKGGGVSGRRKLLRGKNKK